MGSAVEVKGNKQRVPVWGVLATVRALTSVKLLYNAPNDLFVSLSLSLCFALLRAPLCVCRCIQRA